VLPLSTTIASSIHNNSAYRRLKEAEVEAEAEYMTRRRRRREGSLVILRESKRERSSLVCGGRAYGVNQSG
jgi:hypothetical protein